MSNLVVNLKVIGKLFSPHSFEETLNSACAVGSLCVVWFMIRIHLSGATSTFEFLVLLSCSLGFVWLVFSGLFHDLRDEILHPEYYQEVEEEF